MTLQNCKAPLQTINTTSKEDCESKNGYWYENTCWKDFEQEQIKDNEVTSYLEDYKKSIADITLNLNHKTYSFLNHEVLTGSDNFILLFSSFLQDGTEKMMVTTLSF